MQRIFNNGTAEGYGYDKGGRAYSNGGYQSLTQDQRRQITINGEAVVEVDISGSYFTIANALLGMSIDLHRDPYSVIGFPRCIVKSYINCSLGSGKPIAKWPKDLIADYAEADSDEQPNHYLREITQTKYKYTGDLSVDYPISSLTRAVLPLFPMLSRIQEREIDWAPLSYIESCIIIGAVHELCTLHGVSVLPVHDSIICAASKVELVEEVLTRRFHEMVGVKPKLKRK